ncbi:hypothetical protein RCS94_10450 [Orbaceae bacterium ac157xtp]
MAVHVLNPYISVFETEQEQNDYDLWLEKELAISAQDNSQGMPHDEFMAKMEALIEAVEIKK